MSHSFLPVNPCCTDVVLNTPCGCTSTLPNTGCGQNPCETNVILSSNVLYNGPVLDCIIAEPCDTLNVILQKIDEIICNLLVQINTLNIQVANISTQIININNEIININNTLAVCCGATTTTTTTAVPCACTTYRLVGPSVNPGTVTYVPCGSTQVVTQTATNIVELICVDNTTGVIRVGNVSFINLLTCCSAPTTTTTTTLPIPTYCYTLSSVGKVTFYWIDVNGDPQTITITNNTVYVCAQLNSVVASGLAEIEGGIALCTSDLDCAVIPTTTTTTTSAITSICFCIHLEGGGCAYTIELPILGNAPFQNGRPVYNITGDANGTVYYDGSQWIYDSVENSPLLQPLLNSSYYPIGTYSEWGGVDTTYFMNSSTSGPCPTTTTTSSSSTSTSTTSSSSTTTTTTTAEPTTTTTTTKEVVTCSTYKLIATGPSVSPGDTDWAGIDCFTGLPVGGTVTDLASISTGCIVDGSLTYGVKVLVDATTSCAIFELEPTCCDTPDSEYIPLSSGTLVGTVVYATNGYCYTVGSTSLLPPTVGLGDNTTYDFCVDCTTAHPCPTTTTTTTTI